MSHGQLASPFRSRPKICHFGFVICNQGVGHEEYYRHMGLQGRHNNIRGWGVMSVYSMNIAVLE